MCGFMLREAQEADLRDNKCHLRACAAANLNKRPSGTASREDLFHAHRRRNAASANLTISAQSITVVCLLHD
jgi:hypothetical protein